MHIFRVFNALLPLRPHRRRPNAPAFDTITLTTPDDTAIVADLETWSGRLTK